MSVPAIAAGRIEIEIEGELSVPNITKESLTDVALASSTAKSLVVSAGPGTVPMTPATLTYDHLTAKLTAGTAQAALIDHGGQVWHCAAFGLPVDGVSDCKAAIDATVAAASTAGGGTVQLPAGTFPISDGIILPSNITLAGVGYSYTKLVLAGTQTFGHAVMAAGKTGVVVANLHVDVSDSSSLANGITFQLNGSTPCTYCIAENCQVKGHGGHQYLIWSQQGKHIKIVNNFVDGGVATGEGDGQQTGIEVQSGQEVLVSGNTIERIGGFGLDISNVPDIVSPGHNDVRAIGNSVNDCSTGIYHTAVNDSDGNKPSHNVLIADNVVTNSWTYGLYCEQFGASEFVNLKVVNNIFDGVGNLSGSTGVYFLSDASGSPDPTLFVNNEFRGNTIRNVTGTSARGVRVQKFPNLLVADNLVSDTMEEGILINGSDDATVRGNTIKGGGTSAGAVLSSSRVVWEGGRIEGWDAALVGYSGLSVQSSTNCVVRNVACYLADAHARAIQVFATCDRCDIGDNIFLYDYSNSISLNLGTNPSEPDNLRYVTVPSGAKTSASVTNTYCHANSKVDVWRVSGDVVQGIAVPAGGSLTIQTPANVAANTVFRYRIHA